MSRRTALLPVFLALIVPASLTRAQDFQSYKEVLAQQERLYKAKGLLAFVAPGFTMTAPDGTVLTREQAIAKYNLGETGKDQTGSQTTSQKIDRKLDSVSIQGDEAVVLVSSHSTYKQKNLPGAPSPEDREYEWDITQTNRYTWIRTPRGWRLKSIVNVALKALLDGKPHTLPAPASTRP